MKNKLFVFCCLLLAGCSSVKPKFSGIKTASIYQEKQNRSVAQIEFGIPAIQQSAFHYQRKNRTIFNLKFGKPQIVAVADKPEGWGYYQFPTISYLSNGNLHAQWSMHADDIRSYGTPSIGSKTAADGGKTWQTAMPDSSLITGYTLPNGDQLRVVDPKPVNLALLKMPPAIGKTNFRYRKTNFTFYRLKDMPSGVNGVYINRLSSGQNKWKLEQETINDPAAVRYSSKDLVPVVWWGDMRTMTDGSLVAGVYPGYYLKDNGEIDKQMGVVFYRSTDNGHSWKIQGRIPFLADKNLDPVAADRIGFSEPAYDVLADGSLICIIRSADGDGVTNGVGNGPMYASRSTDMGKTWTKPEVIAAAGVLPRLLKLKNGVEVLSSGRPGVQLRFSKSGLPDSWTDAFEMLPYDSKSMEVQYAVSCGYTGMVATGDNRFLLIYADFKYKNAAGEERKAIKIREVIVDPT
ncbi:sialidase family protein [Mucilaginibacter sp.]|uniref:sialidase family protein n=1 Tax=Mucilaginibacter sp. TaxID=1882438 RepID=UPI003B00FDFC